MQCRYCNQEIKERVILTHMGSLCACCNTIKKEQILFCSDRCVMFYIADKKIESKTLNNNTTNNIERVN